METTATDMYICPHRIICFLLAGFLLKSVIKIQVWLMWELHTAETLLFADHKLKNTDISDLYVIVWFRTYVMQLLAIRKMHDA
jgi:hypothetical protein